MTEQLDVPHVTTAHLRGQLSEHVPAQVPAHVPAQPTTQTAAQAATRTSTQDPLVVCIGTSADQNDRVLRSVGGDALVVLAADTNSVVHLLDGAARGAHGLSPAHPTTVRAPGPARGDVLTVGDLTVDAASREVRWRDRVVELSARGFDLLRTLASEPGRVWSFAELTSQVWHRPYVGDDDSVTSAVKRLRARLAQTAPDVGVVSVRGVGYRLVVRSS
ncbi:winged helix-turn-helix domain-containing protein [Thalassiella azotivora]